MKLFYRLWHELETLRSWLFDGDPHIDGHTWKTLKVVKVGNKYRLHDECVECGKECGNTWMSEITYIQLKYQLPPLNKLTTDKERGL